MATITSSVGRGGTNLAQDVSSVQSLLNRHRNAPLARLDVDGKIGPKTIEAIEEFQRRVVKLSNPDGRVDQNGKTLTALNGSGGPATSTPVGPINIKVSHGNKQPTGVTGLPGAANTTTATRYESTLTVSGGLTGSFRCSIYPDNMNVKGHLTDGSYPIYLGFHKAGTPQSADLVVRTNGFRAVLVVNANNSVSVKSNLSSKTTATHIHIHNGYNTWNASTPMSEGCVILHPADWSNFIKLFLDKFTNIDDWKSTGDRVGKKIGELTIGV